MCFFSVLLDEGATVLLHFRFGVDLAQQVGHPDLDTAIAADMQLVARVDADDAERVALAELSSDIRIVHRDDLLASEDDTQHRVRLLLDGGFMVMPRPHLVVVEIVCRGDLDTTGTELGIDMLKRFLCLGRTYSLPMKTFVRFTEPEQHHVGGH